MKTIKKAITLLLIVCLAFPCGAFAEKDGGRLYIFGDIWAKNWGEALAERFFDSGRVVNCAREGALLSEIGRVADFASVREGDTVILSYGFMAKDYRSDLPADFGKNLASCVKEIKKRGAEVVFASVCSTRRQNPATGVFDETKNIFTETMRTYAAENGILYIDLAKLTSDAANRLGQNEIGRLYEGDISLSEAGNRLCAEETALRLYERGILTDAINTDISLFIEPEENAKVIEADLFPEATYCQRFEVYIKNGKNVRVNSLTAPDGDSSTKIESGDRIRLEFSSAEKIQIAPIYDFDLGGFSTAKEAYTLNFGSGVYDLLVKKSEPLRANVCADGFVIVSNLDMPGTEEVTFCSEGEFKKYTIENSTVKITVSGLTDKLERVSVRETQKIFDDKPRVFVAGDSTLCNYYPIERTGTEADGTVQTGWAQYLTRHTDCDVVNLASSGDWAAKWLKETFPTVEREGKKGDILILQFGINDRDRSSVEEMTSSLRQMVGKSAEKGMIPILVSPQISAGYGWGEAADSGKSTGGEYEEFFDAVRELAREQGCFYIDLTDLSAGWFSEIGREAVYRKYHLWNYEKDEPLDTMHLSSKGASAMCSFFVTALKRLKNENSADVWGNCLASLTLW